MRRSIVTSNLALSLLLDCVEDVASINSSLPAFCRSLYVSNTVYRRMSKFLIICCSRKSLMSENETKGIVVLALGSMLKYVLECVHPLKKIITYIASL
jgi:hypothetical protein